MFKFKLVAGLLFFVLITLSIQCSTRKKGCTNASALNYDNEAFEDDGSCKYTTPKTIGELYGGGIVFYTETGGIHGLIAAENDQSDSIPWNNNVGMFAGKTFTYFGKGAANTATVVGAQGLGFYAAKLCQDLELNGQTDWFLPSLAELDTLYNRLKKAGLGNFKDAEYWSSSQANEGASMSINFANGQQHTLTAKRLPLHVRAIRGF